MTTRITITDGDETTDLVLGRTRVAGIDILDVPQFAPVMAVAVGSDDDVVVEVRQPDGGLRMMLSPWVISSGDEALDLVLLGIRASRKRIQKYQDEMADIIARKAYLADLIAAEQARLLSEGER